MKLLGDEDYRWYLTRAVPVRGADGAVMRWYGTHTDIHERKMAERMLTRANQNKDEFLARLAHELRNPLGATQAAIELFKLRLPEDSPLQRQRAVIDRQARHMVRLVDDLSDVSRIGTGKMELRRQRVDLGAIAAEALDTVRAAAASRQHDLVVDIPPDPVMVDGDSARLTQVCVNLLSNAIKYTPHGGHIALTVASDAGGVTLRVRDNGNGIHPEMLASIFDLYTQAAAATEERDAGLGIGLHLVQSLVRLHGGTVTAASDGPGQGSVFEVRLPLAPQ